MVKLKKMENDLYCRQSRIIAVDCNFPPRPEAIIIKDAIMRYVGYAIPFLLALTVMPIVGHAGEFRVGAWNMEHLDENDNEGCVGRIGEDYDVMSRQMAKTGVDVLAFQEVENAAAAHRVFPASMWNVEISRRPPGKGGRACWDRPEARLGHLATGFAIKSDIAYRRNGDLESLGADGEFQRWGTDVTIVEDGGELRLLSVHLRTGCWGKEQDIQDRSAKACATLRGQIEQLKIWIDERIGEGTAFVVLGDFNRRLTVKEDWGWKLLSPPDAPLRLLAMGVPFQCDPQYTDFIDHMVVGGGAEMMISPNSFIETPKSGPHPDHCAISALFRIGG